MILEAIDKHPEGRLACGRESSAGEPPCGNRLSQVQLQVFAAVPLRSGLYIPACRHASTVGNEILGLLKPQPLFHRAVNPDDPS